MKIKLILIGLLCISAVPIHAKNYAGSYQKSNKGSDLYETLILERVVDGDTFYASSRKIRLWGIDAPEKKHPLYAISTKAAEVFIKGTVLECKQIDIDKYQREVMHCYVDNADLGALMVKSGFAKDYKKYSGGFYSGEQNFARDAKLGIWK